MYANATAGKTKRETPASTSAVGEFITAPIPDKITPDSVIPINFPVLVAAQCAGYAAGCVISTDTRVPSLENNGAPEELFCSFILRRLSFSLAYLLSLSFSYVFFLGPAQ